MNIIRVEYIGNGRLSISHDDTDSCYTHFHQPEDSFIRDLALGIWSSQATIAVIESPSWHGNASGLTYETLLKSKVLPLTTGKADILFTWEDGSRTALRVHDGVVHEMDCVIVIGFKFNDTSGGVRTWPGLANTTSMGTNTFDPIRQTWDGTDE